MNQRLAYKPRRFSPLCLSMAAGLLPTAAMFAASPTDNLQSLVNDTTAQVQLAYRQLPNERDQRQVEVEAVVSACALRRGAKRTTSNLQLGCMRPF